MRPRVRGSLGHVRGGRLLALIAAEQLEALQGVRGVVVVLLLLLLVVVGGLGRLGLERSKRDAVASSPVRTGGERDARPPPSSGSHPRAGVSPLLAAVLLGERRLCG